MCYLMKKILIKIILNQIEIVQEKINELKKNKISVDKGQIDIINTEIDIKQESLEFLFSLWMAFTVKKSNEKYKWKG